MSKPSPLLRGLEFANFSSSLKRRRRRSRRPSCLLYFFQVLNAESEDFMPENHLIPVNLTVCNPLDQLANKRA